MAFQFDLVIGRIERHRVAFRYDQWLGRVTINVDGERVVRDWTDLLPFSYSREWRFHVGLEEHHEVLIRKIKQRRPYAGSLAQTVLVFVDGNPSGEYQTR